MNPYISLAHGWIAPRGHAEDLDALQGLRWNRHRAELGLTHLPAYGGSASPPLSVATLHALAWARMEPEEVLAVGAELRSAVERQQLGSTLALVRRCGAPTPSDLELVFSVDVPGPSCELRAGDRRWRLDPASGLVGPGWSEALFESRVETVDLWPDRPAQLPGGPARLSVFRTRSMRPDWTDLVAEASLPAAVEIATLTPD